MSSEAPRGKPLICVCLARCKQVRRRDATTRSPRRRRTPSICRHTSSRDSGCGKSPSIRTARPQRRRGPTGSSPSSSTPSTTSRMPHSRWRRTPRRARSFARRPPSRLAGTLWPRPTRSPRFRRGLPSSGIGGTRHAPWRFDQARTRRAPPSRCSRGRSASLAPATPRPPAARSRPWRGSETSLSRPETATGRSRSRSSGKPQRHGRPRRRETKRKRFG